MVRFQIRLDEPSFKALMHIAQAEERETPRQAALIIRQELERRGLLAAPDKPFQAPVGVEVEPCKHP